MSDKVTPPVPGSPEHDEAMIKLAEEQGVRIRVSNPQSSQSVVLEPKPNAADAQIEPNTPPNEGEPQPENLILGKFKSQAELEEAYKALERKLGAQGKPDVATPGAPKASPQGTPPAAAEKTAAQKAAEAMLAAAQNDEQRAAAQAQLDEANKAAEEAAKAAPQVTVADALKAASDDFAATGQLSDESYAKLEQAGFSRDYVDAYVDGLKARAEVVAMKVYAEAGGQDQYAVMAEWAKANWSPEQIEAHNLAVTSSDIKVVMGAVRTMKAAYTAAQGVDPQARVEPKGGAGNSTPVEMYRNSAEMQADMRDPRYIKGDREFHAKVDRKLEASLRAGIYLGF